MTRRPHILLAAMITACGLGAAPIEAKGPKTPPAPSPPAPTDTLAAANAGARRGPDARSFIDATQVYDYAPGALYELYAAPEFLSTILLDEGEALLTTAAGDTTRWMVEAVPSAGTEDGRTLVLVKPTRTDIRTNIVLATDRRTYLIEAIAVPANAKTQTYSAQIAWRYPESLVRPKKPAGALVALETLNFRYTIKTIKGRKPRWAPVRVFDDGRRTFIEFPLDLGSSEAPPLFVLGPEGAELVNYRIEGNRYVADRLFEEAELRLGDKRPTVVRIGADTSLGKHPQTAGRP